MWLCSFHSRISGQSLIRPDIRLFLLFDILLDIGEFYSSNRLLPDRKEGQTILPDIGEFYSSNRLLPNRREGQTIRPNIRSIFNNKLSQ